MPNRRTENFAGQAARYQLVIDQQVVGEFRFAEGITSEDDWESPTALRPSTIIMRRGYTKSDALHRWRESFIKGEATRKSGVIRSLDLGGQTIGTWAFQSAAPPRISGPTATLDGKGDDIFVNEVALVVTAIERR